MHAYAVFGGIQSEGPFADFDVFVGPSTASSTIGSFAYASRCSSVHAYAPAAHTSARACLHMCGGGVDVRRCA